MCRIKTLQLYTCISSFLGLSYYLTYTYVINKKKNKNIACYKQNFFYFCLVSYLSGDSNDKKNKS